MVCVRRVEARKEPLMLMRTDPFRDDTLDTATIEADHTDGVLTLKLPVAERAKPRRVPINHPRSEKSIDATADSDADVNGADRELAAAGTG
jgi:HSP20 family protein